MIAKKGIVTASAGTTPTAVVASSSVEMTSPSTIRENQSTFMRLVVRCAVALIMRRQSSGSTASRTLPYLGWSHSCGLRAYSACSTIPGLAVPQEGLSACDLIPEPMDAAERPLDGH